MSYQANLPATIQGKPMTQSIRTEIDQMSVALRPSAPLFAFKSSPCVNLASTSKGTTSYGTNSQAWVKPRRRWYSEHDKPSQPRLEEMKVMSRQSPCQPTSPVSTMTCSAQSHNVYIEGTLRLSSLDNCRATDSDSSSGRTDCQFHRRMPAQELNALGHIPRFQSPILSPAKDTPADVKPKGYDGSCEGNQSDPSSNRKRTSNETRSQPSTVKLCATHTLPNEDVASTRSSLDWIVPDQRASLGETNGKEHNLFLNPFNNSSDHQSRKSSATSGYSAYIRPNAFPGHRDTFARILHVQVFPGHEEIRSSGSLSNNATQTRRSSAYATLPYAVLQITSGYLSFAEYKLLRLVCRQWCQDLPPPQFCAFYRLPRELVQQILGYLSPCDFDSSRHTCASWYFASQDRKLQEQMLRLACCKSAFEEDKRLHRSPDGTMLPSLDQLNNTAHGQAVDLSSLGQEWICGKRLATESRLSPDWHGRTTALSSSANRASLVEETDFSKILDAGNGDATRSNFTVSACRKFVLVTSGGDISIFSLSNREDTLKPIVKLAAGVEVLKVSMDTSSGRFAVAALLAGRKGMLWELLDNITQARYRSSSGEPISLGMQADVQCLALSPVSRDIALNLSMRSAESHSASVLQHALGNANLSSDDASPPTMPTPPSYSNEYLGQSRTPDGDAAAELHHDPTRNSIPIETNATTLYTNLGGTDDEPRSVSVCPNRKCLAFGCRMGIELH